MSKRTLWVFILMVIILLGLITGAVLVYQWIYQNSLIPPGKGEKAERGYNVCQPVIDALGQFYAAEGHYPDVLDEMTPAYLGTIPTEVNDMEIIYRKTDEGYSLEFSYTGPGMNHCSYTPDGGWRCYGFY